MCLRLVPLVVKGDLVPSDSEVEHGAVPSTGAQTAVKFDFYSCADGVPRYGDEPNCDFLGTLTVELDEEVMRLALRDRRIRIYLKFGETEIKCRIVVLVTGKELDCTFELATS